MWKIYGALGFIQNPDSVRKQLIRRIDYDIPHDCHWYSKDKRHHNYCSSSQGKYLVRVDVIVQLQTHKCLVKPGTKIFEVPSTLTEKTLSLFPLVINHYIYQSEEFWRVKMSRGDVANWNVGKHARCWDTFVQGNKRANAIEDATLAKRTIQNT